MEYTLKVSEFVNVRPGIFRKTVSVVYAGKINDNKYSIAVTWRYGNQSAAYNLFLSIDQKEVFIPTGKLFIKNVTDNKITFRFEEEIS